MDENDLLAACLTGERGGFQAVVERFQAPAMAMAMNLLGNRPDAEDVCQDVFIRVFRHLPRFDPGRNFKTWFYTILYRRCLDYLKSRRRSRELVKKAGREAKAGPTPNTFLAGAEAGLPSPLLDRLSPRERAAVCLWANEGYTAAEISHVLHCSAATARVYLFQARKKIKKLLEQNHGFVPHR